MRSILSGLGYKYDEGFLAGLIPLLAGAQTHRRENKNTGTDEVTRSTAIVVLNQINPAIGRGLQAAGVDWEGFCRQLMLADPVKHRPVEDVTLHKDFIQALTEFRRSYPDRTIVTAENLALAIVDMAANSSIGKLRGRLEKAGADLNLLVSELLEAVETPESGTTGKDAGEPDEDASAQSARPTVWLLHYKEEDRPADFFSNAGEKSAIAWRSTKIIKTIKPGDPVLYWRDINRKTKDRGGLVGTGRFAAGADAPGPASQAVKGLKQATWYAYPTQIVELFHEKPIPRDELMEQTGLDLNWGLGSILKVPTDTAEKIHAYLIGQRRKGLFPEGESVAVAFIDDAPKTNVDYLNRGILAFMLAGRLNIVWDENNKAPHSDAAPFPSSFVVHVDAPWGGGKTTFANYLSLLLNPYSSAGKPPPWLLELPLHDDSQWPKKFRRAWHTVYFNAWRHQHLDPPWWCFYQAIRRQCFHAARTEDLSVKPRRPEAGADPQKTPDDRILPPLNSPSSPPNWFVRHGSWLFNWTCELAWRVFNPKVRILALSFLVTWAVALILHWFGLFKPQAFAKALEEGLKADTGIPALVTTGLVVLFGGATAIWSLVAAFTDSLLPGTPDAARNYSLGSGDPLERFRRHFAATIRRLRRPVLVVVDDIDRCEPKFVVELLRGIQTILSSPQVIFVLLGDRDWIENAFASVHQAMKGIDVGPEHTLGGRFVEKTIQFSMVLPDITRADRTNYVRQILNVPEAVRREQPDPRLKEQQAQLEEIIRTKDPVHRDAKAKNLRNTLQADPALDKSARQTFFEDMDRELALRSSSDNLVQEATRHRLLPIAPVLPANPRQIKRIINGIALFQEIARYVLHIQPETDDWRKLALWVVIMTEWPKTWAMLSRFPGLIDRIRDSGDTPGDSLPDEKLTRKWVNDTRKNETIMRLLEFKADNNPWSGVRIEAADIEKFRAIMPSGG